MANFKDYSRYVNTTTETNRENKQFLKLREPLQLSRANTDTTIIITKDLIKRPDLISYKAYDNPALWWVIYEYNNITDPLFELKTGQALLIPQLGRVLEAIKRLNI